MKGAKASRDRHAGLDFAAEESIWKRALRDAVRDPDDLVNLLGLPESFRPGARRATRLFPFLVPRSFVARMRRGDPNDPLLRQVRIRSGSGERPNTDDQEPQAAAGTP